MVTGWRRAFCTSIPKDKAPKASSSNQQQQQQNCDDHDIDNNNNNNHRSPKISSKFGFFSSNSNPSTPRLPVASPGLRCRTSTAQTSAWRPNSPKLRCRVSNSVASSPKSPSAFSLLKLRVLSKTRCGICVESVKSGPIFTAECSHSFHFPCIAKHLNTSAHCPVCSAAWNDLPLLAGEAKSPAAVKTFRVYDDDEPLMSPTAGAGFNPIPEEGDEESAVAGAEFQGFFVTKTPRLVECAGGVEVRLLPEAAIVAAGRRYETHAVVMKVRATAMVNPTRRAPVDLVAVIDVGTAAAGIQTAKRAMRLIVSSLGSSDRLSVVAFSSLSKRLLPLRRMTGAGKRSARRIADALGAVAAAEKGISVGDAVKKAAKILEDRREKNPVATIVLLSDSGHPTASAGKFSVRTVGLAGSDSVALARRVTGLLRVAARDVNLRLSVASGSAPAEIAAVYSLAKRPAAVGPGQIRLGDFHVEEEREFLVEIRVPTCSAGSHHVLSVRSSHRDPSSAEVIHSGDHPLLLPRPQAVRSSPSIERLRNLHVATRAVAESRRLSDRGDLSGAHHLLSSARALLLAQSKSASADEFSRGLEAELSELHRLRSHQRQLRSSCYRTDDKSESLTPTSAWRAAERLAKVAIMRKSMNRVSDLHGFENARF